MQQPSLGAVSKRQGPPWKGHDFTTSIAIILQHTQLHHHSCNIQTQTAHTHRPSFAMEFWQVSPHLGPKPQTLWPAKCGPSLQRKIGPTDPSVSRFLAPGQASPALWPPHSRAMKLCVLGCFKAGRTLSRLIHPTSAMLAISTRAQEHPLSTASTHANR